MIFRKYTNKTAEDSLNDLKSSICGISEDEARKRFKIYGINEVSEKESGFLKIFFRQFKSPFFFLLLIAAVVAFFVGEKIDSSIILVFIFVNVILGFSQEARAQKAIALLKKHISLKVKIRREGTEKVIEKKYLVPGDIVILETGNIVPADLRILLVENFLVDESVLSGESVAVAKISDALLSEVKEVFESKNVAFAGTSVTSGKAEGVVIGSGKQTVFGEIAKLVSGITRESVFEKDILKFSKIILRTVVIAVVFVFVANLAIKGTENFFNFLLFSIALIVSIIPEALPVIITFAFSSGAMRLAREKVVVKRLSAVEDLGNIEVLCTDKTGTLTKNKLELDNIFAKDKEKLALYGLITSCYLGDGVKKSLNSFDSSLYDKSSQVVRDNLKNFKEIYELPFDSIRLRNSSLVENEKGERILIVKGAPEVILGLSSNFEFGVGKDEVKKEIEKEGSEGKRVLAVAFRSFLGEKYSIEDEKDFVFLGFFSFTDPLKETSKEAIHTAKILGVQIKMITGDSKEVAGHISKKIGLITNSKDVVLGAFLSELSEEKFDELCQKTSVFARISPEMKLKIIKSLQKKYEVGFLGEGMNDTPALKAANVGIAVQEAADVSREAADIILLEKDLRVIIDGIKNGRNIFSNINKYIKCAMASNFGNFYSIAVISLFINFLPMLPIQILLGNLLSDFPLIAITTDSVDAEELKKPKAYQLNTFVRLIIILALISTIFDFIFFAIFHGIKPELLQTLWFVESILTELALIFAIRTHRSFLRAKRPSLPLILLAIFDAIFIVLMPFTFFGKDFFHFASPPIHYLLIVFALVFLYFTLSEIAKLLYFRFQPLKQNHDK